MKIYIYGLKKEDFFKMITELSITIPGEQEKNSRYILNEISRELSKQKIKFSQEEIKTVLLKKSIDARRKQIKLVLKYRVFIGQEISYEEQLPVWKKVSASKTVAIVGSGPAGLFGALKLLEYGIKPVVIERGSSTSKRKRDIALISTKGTVDGNSNYCFGEGGAGTFSDGKLYTRSNKRGNINSVLQIFVHFGADKKILTDAHPHIGTDRLPEIINNMRNFIISQGGEFHFDTKCTGFLTEKKSDGKIAVRGISALNLNTNETKEFICDAVLLATGHSATDIYELIGKISPQALEAKTFAVGVRVEHPRQLIDSIQFHNSGSHDFGAAEYRLTTQVDERGVYSFCMCPGGFVVPSSTGPEEIVVNGMSAAGRNSRWSNAAIVVETRPQDIPQEFKSKAEKLNVPALSSLFWRQHIEHLTFLNGENQKAPAQLITDFMEEKQSTSLTDTSYAPGVISSPLHKWLPPEISRRLKKGFSDFNRKMKGYICSQGILIASETRTSTPVRICRSKESGECSAIERLFPAGEGSGYAGGIVSSAMDGENQCVKIAELFSAK